MTERPLTIPRARPDDAASQHDGGRLFTGYVLQAELDGAPLAIVAVDGGSPRADPIARAEHAVRVLLMYRNLVISDATRSVAHAHGSS